MESSKFIGLLWLILFCCCTVLCAPDGDSKLESCNVTGAVRLDAIMIKETSSTCESAEGRVQLCEGGHWLNLCDSNWTLDDAKVTCRSLNYSSQGRAIINFRQVRKKIFFM